MLTIILKQRGVIMSQDYKTAGGFNETAGSMTVFEMRAPSFSHIYLRNTESGQPIRDALYKHTQDVMERCTTLDEVVKSKNVTVLDIPRGGVPSAIGAVDYMQENMSLSSLKHLSSQIKTAPNDLFPDNMNFANVDILLMVDAVVATGKTICDHLDQIPESFTGKIVLLSNATAEKGIKAFNDALHSNGLEGFHVTGGIIADKDCVLKVVDGKEVYIVGLGDIGEAVSVDPGQPAPRQLRDKRFVR
jgi:uracil phosphoribosyltransferase